MSFFDSMNISASGLTAQRLRMDVISENIANANTTRTSDGGPFNRRTAVFEPAVQANFAAALSGAMGGTSRAGGQGRGVRVSRIATDDHPGPRVYDPSHPDADGEGYVQMPNVNVVMEMVNMISASRSYEANITAMNITRGMITRTMELGNAQ